MIDIEQSLFVHSRLIIIIDKKNYLNLSYHMFYFIVSLLIFYIAANSQIMDIEYILFVHSRLIVII